MTDPFRDAVVDAQHTLDRRGYDHRKAAIYASEDTITEARTHADYVPYGGDLSDPFGAMVVEPAEIPDSLVVAVHLDAAQYGPDAVAFGVIDADG